MDTSPLTNADRELIDHAVACNERVFDPEFMDGAHVVAAAVRTTDGATYDGVSLPTTVGRASVHGEPVAVGAAIADGHTHDEIETCVAVSCPLPDHEKHPTRVITPVDGVERVVRAIDLLPERPW